VVGQGEDRRVASDWSTIAVQGPAMQVARPTDALPAGALVRPPEKLGAALAAAFDTKVTGGHTAREYIDALQAEGHYVYLTGGAIRDAVRVFTQRPDATVAEIAEALKDVDIVTTAPPPTVRRIAARIAPEYPEGAVWSPAQVDQFGSVLIGGPKAGLSNPEGLDVTSMRSEGAFTEPTKHRDTGETAFPYTFDHDLNEDAGSRDFTMNSLYFDPLNGLLVDPSGRGIADAERGSLRVSRTDSLSKDDNIALRFWKFRIRGYTADRETTGLIRENASEVAWALPRWRMTNNLARMCPKTAQSKKDIVEFFGKLEQVMREDGCHRLYEKRMLPLLDKVADKVVGRIERARDLEARRAAAAGDQAVQP
jgi:tRNA nucleotidyltransferase/poly(A) polymerase